MNILRIDKGGKICHHGVKYILLQLGNAFQNILIIVKKKYQLSLFMGELYFAAGGKLFYPMMAYFTPLVNPQYIHDFPV